MIVRSTIRLRREISTAMKAASAPRRNAGAAACEITCDSWLTDGVSEIIDQTCRWRRKGAPISTERSKARLDLVRRVDRRRDRRLRGGHLRQRPHGEGHGGHKNLTDCFIVAFALYRADNSDA
jgi:hypothetical protein